MPDETELIAAAEEARACAYAPYSGFKVGAAILAADGTVHRGCNVENVAYPEGTCAEAGAISAMVASGQTALRAVAVIADGAEPVMPCGGCRQKLLEFAEPDAVITVATTRGARQTLAVADLLPGAFAKAQMDKH